MSMKKAYLGPKQSAMVCSDPILCDITLLTFNHGPVDSSSLYPTIREEFIKTNNLDLDEGVFRRYLKDLIDGDVISYNSGMYDVKSSLTARLIYRHRRFGTVLYKLIAFYDSLLNVVLDISSSF